MNETELTVVVMSLVNKRGTKLGLDLTDTDYVGSIVEEVRQAILNYCNISSVPSDLKYVWMNMSLDLLRWWGSQIPVGQGSGSGGSTTLDTPMVVTSVREGSVTLSMKRADESSQDASGMRTIKGVLDEITMNYHDNLNKFRRMTWL
jgi:ABC-type dipeptide/oligopeptide/nickel transport system ATPase subunit